jgi:hypothetical protein
MFIGFKPYVILLTKFPETFPTKPTALTILLLADVLPAGVTTPT